jgi:hypothetical protein
MRIPSGTLDSFRSGIDGVFDALSRSPDTAALRTSEGASLELLAEAFRQLVEVMTRVEADNRTGDGSRTGRRAGGEDVTELGEYAFKLQENLAGLVRQPELADQQDSVAVLTVELALWIAAHGGRLDSIEALVDALALIANRTTDPGELGRLSAVMGRIIDAVSPVIREDLEKMNPGRPWRVLLLNRGIVATRSHDPAMMEEAFTFLIHQLPEDAGQFFAAGMQQMEALNYPAHVRRVMEKYHRQWTVNHTLH